MSDKTIQNPRTEIDAIDGEILRLLNRRAEIALRVGAAKTKAEASLCDPGRENEVIERLTKENPGPFDRRGIANIFQRIIDESLHLQQSTYHRPAKDHSAAINSIEAPKGSRVAFLGEHGTFSETAALGILGNSAEYVSYPDFDTLFGAIERGETDHIISPLENSLVGSIHRCYDLLLNSDLSIVAEIILPVSHFLIACEGATLETIKTVESHPAALGQCDRFFSAHPHLGRIAAGDTAGSVKRAVESGDVTRAAIGGRRTAEIYGGTIIREHIEDHNENYTRFVLLARGENTTADGNKISLVISLSNEPGSLHNALRPFVRRNIDLLKIESRPIKGDPTKFSFYLDLRPPSNENDLSGAFEEIRELSDNVRFLGRYPAIRLTDEQIQNIE